MARLGLALPSRPATWAALVALAQQAEALGLDSLWLADPDEDENEYENDAVDPLVALAGLARATTTIRLGTFALDASRRPPGVLAKALATIDRLSGGRLTVALAPGDDTASAAGQLAELLHVLRAAFAGGTVDHAGRFLQVEGLRVDPGPVQRPSPPLWVVGRSEPLLALAAAQADGWNPGTWVTGADEVRVDAARADEACRRAGRDPATLARSAGWSAVGRRADLVAAAAGWTAAGVVDLVGSPGALPFGETTTDDLRRMASATE
ncbi:MAG: LLM class flavin-dependent oxidoreductase [Acidimicrobiales bacterium]